MCLQLAKKKGGGVTAVSESGVIAVSERKWGHSGFREEGGVTAVSEGVTAVSEEVGSQWFQRGSQRFQRGVTAVSEVVGSQRFQRVTAVSEEVGSQRFQRGFGLGVTASNFGGSQHFPRKRHRNTIGISRG